MDWGFGIFVALVVAFFVGVYLWYEGDTSRLHDARNRAVLICGADGAVTYDVQDQDELVYACNSDHVLRTLGY